MDGAGSPRFTVTPRKEASSLRAGGGDELRAPIIPVEADRPFISLLSKLGASLVVTMRYSHVVAVIYANESGLNVATLVLDDPSAAALTEGSLAVACHRQIWVFGRAANLVDEDGRPLENDVCFTPRMSTITGELNIQDMGWIGAELVFASSRFSALCTLSHEKSFTPYWRPPFIKQLAPETRCNLTGFAASDGRLRYVTAAATADEADGWKRNAASSGVLLEAPEGKVVLEGLSVPRCPRLYNGKLYFLNSGAGKLMCFDPDTGAAQSLCDIPGYGFGLTFSANYAFFGVSPVPPAEEQLGLPIAARRGGGAGICAVDLGSGALAGTARVLGISGGVTDLHAASFSKSLRIVGFEDHTVDNIFILP